MPVDYTELRHVRKPAGARPGMVIYDTNRTAYVTPDRLLAQRLRKKIWKKENPPAGEVLFL